MNYRKKKINAFFQIDNLYTQTLNKNEFVTRTYSDGTIINQQLKWNRNTNYFTSKAWFGLSWGPIWVDFGPIGGPIGPLKGPMGAELGADLGRFWVDWGPYRPS